MDGLSWALVYFVLPIGLGNLIYIAAPWTRFFLEKDHLSMREKRIRELIDNYRWVKRRKEDKQYLGIRLAGLAVIYLLLILALPIFCSIIIRTFYDSWGLAKLNTAFLFPWIVGVSLAYYLVLLMGNRLTNTINIYKFDMYKDMTIKKLIKLGGNPEDLDKEEG